MALVQASISNQHMTEPIKQPETLSGVPSSIDKKAGTHTEPAPYDGINKLPVVAPKPPFIQKPITKNPV